jgi:histidine triad (HIT) family protein
VTGRDTHTTNTEVPVTDGTCLFCKMASGEMDVPKLYDDDLVFAIRDINPRAPVHLLVIPKAHVPDAREVGDRQAEVLGRMFAVSSALAEGDGLRGRGYRLAFNVGEDAGMTVPHLHMHVLGGRQLGAEG